MSDGRATDGLAAKVGALAYSLALWPLVPLRAVVSPDDVPALRAFEARWVDIRDEVRAALDATPAPPFRRVVPQPLIRTDSWGALVVRLYGTDSEANRRRLPVVASLLDDHPDVVTAIVTTLAPGTRVQWHVGILKCVLRGHIPLEVPPGDVGLQVLRRRLRWEEGRALLFDDTYPHRVWNATDGTRVILLLDIMRPTRRRWLARANRAVLRRLAADPGFHRAIASADRHAAPTASGG